MYQEVGWTNITSGIIKDMKIEVTNKWRKAYLDKLDTSLDTSSTLASIKTYEEFSTRARSIENYDFRILKSESQLMMTWIIRVVSFSKTLDHTKDLF